MSQKGFTLIEILIVIAIIGILAGVVLVSTTSARNKAQWAKYTMEVRSASKMVQSAAMSKRLAAISGYACLGNYAHVASDACWGANLTYDISSAQYNSAIFPAGDVPKGPHPPTASIYGTMMYSNSTIVRIYSYVGQTPGGVSYNGQCDNFGWEKVTKYQTYCTTDIDKW